MSKAAFNIMIVGIGGQGVMTLGRFFREIAVNSEQIHGLISMESRGVSQREGSVYALIRYSLDPDQTSKSLTPTPPIQGIDLMIALEPLEFLRNLHYLNPVGTALVNSHTIIPKNTLISNEDKYPDIDTRINTLREQYPQLHLECKNFTQKAFQLKKPAFYANYLMITQLQTILEKFVRPTKFSELLQDFFNHV